MKDWAEFQEPYTEEFGVAEDCRRRALGEMEAFIAAEQKKADERRAAFVSPEKMRAAREDYRAKFIDMLGFPLNRPDIPAGKGEEKIFVRDDGAYVYSRMRVEIAPGLWAYGVYAESKAEGKKPFVLAQHGGGGTPEVVNGWTQNSGNYVHLARRCKKKGANVFSAQTYMWNSELYGVPFDRIIKDGAMRQLGGSMTALEMFLFTRLFDRFSVRPEIDCDRMGIMGLSYGGMHALTFAAVDTRVKSAYSSCFFNDRAKVSWGDWSYLNQLSMFKDAEAGGLVAPRALYVEVGSDDPIFLSADAEREAERLKEYYRAAGAEDKLRFHVFPGVHEVSHTDEGFDFFLENL